MMHAKSEDGLSVFRAYTNDASGAPVQVWNWTTCPTKELINPVADESVFTAISLIEGIHQNVDTNGCTVTQVAGPWTDAGSALKQSDDKARGSMTTTWVLDLAQLDAEAKAAFIGAKNTYYTSFALMSNLGSEVAQYGSQWMPMTTVKPVVKAVVPVVKDEKKKSKRHTCGKGASYLVMGASTMAAASMLLY